MNRIYSLPDLHLIRDYTKRNIKFIEEELSRRYCNDLRKRLISYETVIDEINDQIDNHHQIRIVS